MGLGLFGGGVGAVKFFLKQSRLGGITVTDLRPEAELKESINQISEFLAKLPDKKRPKITYHLGGHRKDDFRKADLIVVNPAVPADSSFLAIARRHHITLTSETNLFFQYCPCRIVGITGSNGKTTATALLGEILKSAIHPDITSGQFAIRNVWVGGNIGRGSLLEIVDQISARDLAVLELSSFQLEDLGKTEKSPWMSIILNIKPNHLDRHKTMEAYVDAKKNIIRYQDAKSYTILNLSDPELRTWALQTQGKVFFFSTIQKLHEGGFISEGHFCLRLAHQTYRLCRLKEIKLLGKFNYENVLAASTAAALLDVPPKTIARVIRTFKSVEHRLEFVAEIRGVKYYNDSIATNPESTIGALQSVPGKIILLAGGYDKQLPFDELAREIKKRVKMVILVGATAEKIREALLMVRMNKKSILMAKSFPSRDAVATFEEAVHLAVGNAQRGNTVLLSPACASYDMFRNFTERGNLFKQLIRAPKKSN